MKTEKTKLYKIYFFSNRISRYVGIPGLYSSIDEFLNFLQSINSSGRFYAFLLRTCSLIKIPFFGYLSSEFTGYEHK